MIALKETWSNCEDRFKKRNKTSESEKYCKAFKFGGGSVRAERIQYSLVYIEIFVDANWWRNMHSEGSQLYNLGNNMLGKHAPRMKVMVS